MTPAPTRLPRRPTAARGNSAPLLFAPARGGQVNEKNRCYRNATNAALIRDVRFCAHLASIHPCTAWQSTLRTVTDALQAFLTGRGAVSVATAQPLAAAIAAVTRRSSAYFIGGLAASKLHAILPVARDELAATAVRSVPTRLSLIVAGDGIFALPPGGSAAAETTAPLFRL